MEFYSQYGEDYNLYEFFGKKKNGIAVDIGAMEGIRFSNSYIFSSQLDWTVICVEPHIYYYNLLLSKRTEKNCIKINSAVSYENNENGIFYANSRGSLSSLDKNFENHFKTVYGAYFTGFEEQKVKISTLDSLIENNFDMQQRINIDFMSIDVEGTEVDVLKGLSIDKYGPRVFVIEANKPKEIQDYLNKFGYRYVTNTGCNGYYVRTEDDDQLLSKIITQYPQPKLNRIVHPLGWD